MNAVASEIEVKVGSVIHIDNWKVSEVLLPGDDFSPFRVATQSGGPIKSLAVRIEITGRSIQYLGWMGKRIRIRVVFPGDGEPDTHASGWLLL